VLLKQLLTVTLDTADPIVVDVTYTRPAFAKYVFVSDAVNTSPVVNVLMAMSVS
jgi:hypothetical protein